MKSLSHKKNRGQAMLVMVIFVMAASLSLMFTSSNAIVGGKKDLRLTEDSRESYYHGEAGVEDVLLRLKRGLAVSQPFEIVRIGTASSTIFVEETPSGKQFTALGASGDALRNVRGSVVAGTGVSFNYGLHVGSSGVTMNSSSRVNGSVLTNGSISGAGSSRITGDAYAVGTISSPDPTIDGVKQAGVSPVPLPEVDTAYWKAQANINNDPYIGNLEFNGSSVNTLGPKKVQGNLSLNSSSRLTVTGPIHVTGNLQLNSSSKIFLDERFGSTGTVIIVDGTISFNSSDEVNSTNATPPGYIMFVTLSPSSNAVSMNSSATADALIYAPNGTVQFNSSSKAVSVVAKGVVMNSSASIVYDIGLANGVFTSGPGGGFEISSWGEVE